MEVNKKIRGQKHHYNKARYQNKAKVISKDVSEKAVFNRNDSLKESDTDRALQSNWHRYKELSEDENEQVDESTNFSLLAQAPISHGGHFQFKSDKNVESEFDFENLRKNKMFSLDLHLLECGLSTIPFYERCGLDGSYLSKSDLEEIGKRTDQNVSQYESYLKLKSITKDFSKQSMNSSSESSRNSEEYSSDDKECIEEVLAGELKSISTKNDNAQEVPDTSEVKKTNKPNLEIKEDKEELEEWLDDILND